MVTPCDSVCLCIRYIDWHGGSWASRYIIWDRKETIIRAIFYLESKFDLITLSCRNTGRLYLISAIERSGVLIRTKFIVWIA